jgi:hypothetical protein
MSDKKPNVFPTPEQMRLANETGDMINNQFQKENKEFVNQVSEAERAAMEEMKRRTEEQLRLRNEQLKKNQEAADKLERENKMLMNQNNNGGNNTVPPNNQYSNQYPMEQPKPNQNIEYISQPQMNQPFDLLPLPSGGKLYPSKKKTIKVAYLTTADENILTSPNLIESGDFLEILLNRKILEPELRYKDLIPGDRDAIMLWLRATGYGEIYPIEVYNKKDDTTFETDVDLSKLKTIELTVEPDSEGLFHFQLPTSKAMIKFKLLTIGDIEYIEKLSERNKDSLINEGVTLLLKHQIVDVNGNRDRNFINQFVDNMRILDSKELRKYMNDISCGIDMNIEVQAPGGESIKTFLPLTVKFFWPDFQL